MWLILIDPALSNVRLNTATYTATKIDPYRVAHTPAVRFRSPVSIIDTGTYLSVVPGWLNFSILRAL